LRKRGSNTTKALDNLFSGVRFCSGSGDKFHLSSALNLWRENDGVKQDPLETMLM